MLHLRYARYLLPLVSSAIITACSKTTEDQPNPAVTEKFVPENVVAVLDSLPSQTINMRNVVLAPGVSVTSFLAQHDPDFLTLFPAARGTTGVANYSISPNASITEKKQWIHAHMLQVGANYTDISKHEHSAGLPGANEPEQRGLAYVFGSRNINARQSAEDYRLRQNPQPSGPWCSEKLYGLDCSGFVGQMAAKAGLTGIGGLSADNQFEVEKWNEAIGHTYRTPNDLSGLLAKKFTATELPKDKLEPGDIIFWQRSASNASIRHSGIVLRGNNGTLIFQSNGDWEATAAVPATATTKAKRARPCSDNYDPTQRGPRTILIDDINKKLAPMQYAGAIRLDTDNTYFVHFGPIDSGNCTASATVDIGGQPTMKRIKL